MKTAYWVGAVIIVAIVLGLIVHGMQSSSTLNSAPVNTGSGTVQSNANSNTVPASSASSSGAAGNVSSPASAAAKPATQHFSVNGNDQTADLKTITVAAGTPVTITFGADAGTTYHGGLDFRSSVVNTGTITPGSTKTISFTAAKSFSFTPYWPATNIAKPYTIDIVVH